MLSDVLESQRMFAIAMRRPGTRREVPMVVAGLGLARVCVGTRKAHRTFCSLA